MKKEEAKELFTDYVSSLGNENDVRGVVLSVLYEGKEEGLYTAFIVNTTRGHLGEIYDTIGEMGKRGMKDQEERVNYIG